MRSLCLHTPFFIFMPRPLSYAYIYIGDDFFLSYDTCVHIYMPVSHSKMLFSIITLYLCVPTSFFDFVVLSAP